MKWLPLHFRRQVHLSSYMLKILNGQSPSNLNINGGDQVPSAGHHVGGWVIFSPKNTVSTWY